MRHPEARAGFYELRLRTRSGLARAFGEVMACVHVEDCLVDEASRTLLFTAPSKFAASILQRAQADLMAPTNPHDLD